MFFVKTRIFHKNNMFLIIWDLVKRYVAFQRNKFTSWFVSCCLDKCTTRNERNVQELHAKEKNKRNDAIKKKNGQNNQTKTAQNTNSKFSESAVHNLAPPGNLATPSLAPSRKMAILRPQRLTARAPKSLWVASWTVFVWSCFNFGLHFWLNSWTIFYYISPPAFQVLFVPKASWPATA